MANREKTAEYYREWRKRADRDKKQATGKMCPLSPAIPTKMTREGFARACKRIRDGGKFKLDSENWLCPECQTGRLLDEEKFFGPPPHIQFVTLEEFDPQGEILAVMVKKIRLRREAGMYPLLTQEIAAFIRSWHRTRPDLSQKKMSELLGISRRHVGRIIHGQRWKE